MATLDFDAEKVEPFAEFTAIPEGKYQAVITESSFVATKAGTGEYLSLKFTILEGEYEGRWLTERLNLKNPSEKAVLIARAKLSSICRSIGVLRPKDSYDLHDLPLVIDVKCISRKDKEGQTNEIKGFYPREAAKATPPATSQDRAPWASKPKKG